MSFDIAFQNVKDEVYFFKRRGARVGREREIKPKRLTKEKRCFSLNPKEKTVFVLLR